MIPLPNESQEMMLILNAESMIDFKSLSTERNAKTVPTPHRGNKKREIKGNEEVSAEAAQ